MPVISSTKRKDAILIMDLQIKNHFSNLSDEEKKEYGFISLLTDKDVLKALIETKLVFIAKDQFSHCAGYVFAIPYDFAKDLRFFKPLAYEISKHSTIAGSDCCILGQICVARKFQGSGIALKLYKRLERELASRKIKTLITEVDISNQRSLAFHKEKADFNTLSLAITGGQEFAILSKHIGSH